MTDSKPVDQEKKVDSEEKSYKEKYSLARRYQTWCDLHPWDVECKIYDV